jgi:hypothetical protein
MTKYLATLVILGLLLAGCTSQTGSNPVNSVPVLNVSDLTVNQADGVAIFKFTLSAAASTESSVFIRSADGSARAGVDYVTPPSGKIVFPAGVTTETLRVQILNDGIKRANRSFQIVMDQPSNLTLVKGTALATIIDSNFLPGVSFQQTAQVISKSTGSATIVATLSIPAPERIVVPYTVSGTTTVGIDHNFSSGFIVFQVGSQTATITGSIFDNHLAGPNKTIIFTLTKTDAVNTDSNKVHTIIVADSNANLVATATGVPVGTNNIRILDVSISGLNVTKYVYKIIATNTCDTNSGYSVAKSVSQHITDDISAMNDGSVYLCILGGNDQNVFQSSFAPTSVTWTKNTNPPGLPQFRSLLSVARVVGPLNYLTNIPRVNASIGNLLPGYTVALYDSATCAADKEIGRRQVSAATDSVDGLLTSDGAHVISAKSFDQFQLSSDCATLINQYTLDTSPPTVTDVSSTSTAGAYGPTANISIVITFSKQIVVSGAASQAPYLTMNTTPTVGIATFVGFSGNQMTFNYHPDLNQKAPSLDYLSSSSLVPSGSQIQDLAGNGATLTLSPPGTQGSLSSKVTLLIDTIAPSAVSAFADGLWGTLTTTPVMSWVSADDPGGSGVASYQIAVGTTPGGTDILSWTTVLSSPAQLRAPFLEGNTYYASIRAVDGAGNVSSVVQGNGWSVDPTPPSVFTVSTAATKTFNRFESPQISWTQSSDSGGSGFDRFQVALGTSQGASDVVPWTDVADNQYLFTFNYSGTYGTTYYPSVHALDKAGNIRFASGPSWLVVRPNSVPVPAWVLTSQVEQPVSSTIISNAQAVSGLDIPAQLAVSGDGNPQFSINNGSWITVATVNNGDQVRFRMTTSAVYGTTQVSTVTIGTVPGDQPPHDETPYKLSYSLTTWACPTNYTYVPASGTVGQFCVSKYQANIQGSAAVSSPSSTPSSVSKTVAKSACEANGAAYALISNPQWQVIAKNIEATSANWSSGTVGSGLLQGGAINLSVYSGIVAADSSDLNSCAGGSHACSLTSWDKYRRVAKLPNGSYIWDFAGLQFQWVSDTFSANLFNDPTSWYCPDGSGSTCFWNIGDLANVDMKAAFAPAGDYKGRFSYFVNSEWGGIGYISDSHLSGPALLTQRGGGLGDETNTRAWQGGVFAVRTFDPNVTGSLGGIRCVYQK